MADEAPSRPRSVAFRLELGGRTGWGHLARCAALAMELKARGWTSLLWCNGDLHTVPADLRAAFDRVHLTGENWTGNPPRAVVDADWVVVDFYGIDDRELRTLRVAIEARRGGKTARLLVLDDEARRTLDAATIVLNPRLGLEASPYAPGVETLLGERFVLLRPGLQSPERLQAPLPDSVDPVLVMLGGTDPGGLTEHVLDALADVDPQRFAPVLIRPRTLEVPDELRWALDRFGASVWLGTVTAPALAAWARVCRFAISAAGGTLYELAYLGLPFVAIIAAENQRAFAAEVERQWHLPVVEGDEQLRATAAAAFRELVHRCARNDRPAEESWRTVDGRGAARVADRLEQGRA